MRLEMSHLADIAAGVGLTIAEKVMGAFDDTIKLGMCPNVANLVCENLSFPAPANFLI